MTDLTPAAQLAADEFARAVATLRDARRRLATAEVPMDLVDGAPPAWASDQHEAVVRYYKAWEGVVRARSKWIAVPKT